MKKIRTTLMLLSIVLSIYSCSKSENAEVDKKQLSFSELAIRLSEDSNFSLMVNNLESQRIELREMARVKGNSLTKVSASSKAEMLQKFAASNVTMSINKYRKGFFDAFPELSSLSKKQFVELYLEALKLNRKSRYSNKPQIRTSGTIIEHPQLQSCFEQCYMEAGNAYDSADATAGAMQLSCESNYAAAIEGCNNSTSQLFNSFCIQLAAQDRKACELTVISDFFSTSMLIESEYRECNDQCPIKYPSTYVN
jgi:hypothetical protein